MQYSLEASGLYLICKTQREARHCPLCLFPGLSGGVRSAQQAKTLKVDSDWNCSLASSYAGRSAKAPSTQPLRVDVSVKLAAIAAFCNSPLPHLNCPPHWRPVEQEDEECSHKETTVLLNTTSDVFQSRVVKSFDLIVDVRKRRGHNTGRCELESHPPTWGCMWLPTKLESCWLLTVDVVRDHDTTGLWKKPSLHMQAVSEGAWRRRG